MKSRGFLASDDDPLTVIQLVDDTGSPMKRWLFLFPSWPLPDRGCGLMQWRRPINSAWEYSILPDTHVDAVWPFHSDWSLVSRMEQCGTRQEYENPFAASVSTAGRIPHNQIIRQILVSLPHVCMDYPTTSSAKFSFFDVVPAYSLHILGDKRCSYTNKHLVTS